MDKATSKTQIKAVRAYEKRNPGKAYYMKQKASANAFTRMTTPKATEAIAAVGIDQYREDLQALRDAINEKLNEM